MSFCRRVPTNIRLLDEAYNSVHLPESQKIALKNRLISLLYEYHKRSSKYACSYHLLRIIITVGSLIVPALLSVQYTTTSTSSPSENPQQNSIEVYWIVWTLSLFVTISNGVVTLLKIDKKYYVLHTTYHHLMSESWMYIQLSGKYACQNNNHAIQFPFFCHALEKIRMKQVEEEYYKVLEQNNNNSFNELVPPTPPIRVGVLSAEQLNDGSAPHFIQTTVRRKNSQTFISTPIATGPPAAPAPPPQLPRIREDESPA